MGTRALYYAPEFGEDISCFGRLFFLYCLYDYIPARGVIIKLFLLVLPYDFLLSGSRLNSMLESEFTFVSFEHKNTNHRFVQALYSPLIYVCLSELI